jgi:outer membrane receptor for ferrienterochelin and colicins
VSAFCQSDTVNAGQLLKNNISLEDLMNIDVVTPTGQPQRLQDAPSIVHVITSPELELKGALNIIDALKYIPGLETSVGPDGMYNISIRGMRKDGLVLLMIDGIIMNDFYTGSPILDYPVEFIERLEVLEGPASAVYGTHAFTGVINIITKQEYKDIIAKVGTHGTASLFVNDHITKTNWSASYNLGYFHTDGANQMLETDRAEKEPWSLTYGDKKALTNRHVDHFQFGTNIKYKSLKFTFFGLERERGAWAGPVYVVTRGSKFRAQQIGANIENTFRPSELVSIIPSVYSAQFKANNLEQETPENYVSLISNDVFTNGKLVSEKYTGYKVGTQLLITMKFNENFSLSTASLYEIKTLSEYNLERNYQITGDIYKGELANYDNVPFEQKDKTRKISATYLTTNYTLKRIAINVGVRVDNFNDFGSTVNPRIGLSYSIHKNLRLKTLYGSAFRAPSFKELYDNTSIGNDIGVKGNPKLKPETILTYEVLAELTLKHLLIKSTGYYFDNQNSINIYDPNGSGSIGVQQNIGDIKGYGYSVETRMSMKKNFSWFANFNQIYRRFTWNEEVARKSDIVFYSKRSFCDHLLKNIPIIRINTGLTYTYKKFEFFVGGNYGYASENNHRFYLEESHFANIPEYFQGNYTVCYWLSPAIKIFVQGNNIGKKYSDPDESTSIDDYGKKGLLQPGDTHILGIKYNFEKRKPETNLTQP